MESQEKVNNETVHNNDASEEAKLVNQMVTPLSHRDQSSSEMILGEIKYDSEMKYSSPSTSNTPAVIKRKYSRTHYYKQRMGSPNFKRVEFKEFLSETDSLSQTTSIPCFPKKVYSEKGLLKRNIIKNLDPIQQDPMWIEGCTFTLTWPILIVLENMIDSSSPAIAKSVQALRFESVLQKFVTISADGFNFDYLDSISKILDYLSDHTNEEIIKKHFSLLLINAEKPIFMKSKTDIFTQFETLQNYFTVLGCLLLTSGDDNNFENLHKAFMWQLVTPDKERGPNTIRRVDIIIAATPILVHTVTKMIALSSVTRFTAYVELAMVMACHSNEICLKLLEENILDAILSRYNPYFPYGELAAWDVVPEHPHDYKIKLGDSTIHSNIVLSLLLVLLKCAIEHVEKNPNAVLPMPTSESIKYFAWAFRYECRLSERRHERTTMCVITSALLRCFGRRLFALPLYLMADVLSLSIATEVPFKPGWISEVSFNKSAKDVLFKTMLLYLSLNFIKTFPENIFMVEYRYWLMGLLYLLDPELSSLRTRWSPSLFQELHKTTLQTLTCSLHLIPSKLIRQHALIKRLLWYVEWYSICPYDICTLYWILRLLFAATYKKNTKDRKEAVMELFNYHGFFLLAELSHKLLDENYPITEKHQAIIALNLRMLTSSYAYVDSYDFKTYTKVGWTDFAANLGFKMLALTMLTFDRGYRISDRFLINLMNYLWEAIVWNKNYRETLVLTSGIYKLLDLIAVSSPSVQCITLAVLCDLVRGSNCVAQLITWRARLQVDEHRQVKHGSTIITLLASIYREDCYENGTLLDENGIIQDLDNPLMSRGIRELLKKNYPIEMVSRNRPISYTASDFAGSRASKVHAILQLLSEDLRVKVEMADEKYNLYKNVEISNKDEIIMILCLHHLTAKLQESWAEYKFRINDFLPEDKTTFEEFLHIGKGWARQIQKHQQAVLRRERKKQKTEEETLYSFLGRARLGIALDSLREIRCMARTGDRTILTHCLLQDVVIAHHRRSAYCHEKGTKIFPTYQPKLDTQNLIGQNVKTQGVKCYDIPKTKKNVSTVFMHRLSRK